MILELVMLYVKIGEEQKFENDFKTAGQYISFINGYQGHSLRRCMEQSNKYVLMVNWMKLEDHMIGFRESEPYQEWKKLLHHYYDPFPIVEHYEMIIDALKK